MRVRQCALSASVRSRWRPCTTNCIPSSLPTRPGSLLRPPLCLPAEGAASFPMLLELALEFGQLVAQRLDLAVQARQPHHGLHGPVQALLQSPIPFLEGL